MNAIVPTLTTFHLTPQYIKSFDIEVYEPGVERIVIVLRATVDIVEVRVRLHIVESFDSWGGPQLRWVGGDVDHDQTRIYSLKYPGLWCVSDRERITAGYLSIDASGKPSMVTVSAAAVACGLGESLLCIQASRGLAEPVMELMALGCDPLKSQVISDLRESAQLTMNEVRRISPTEGWTALHYAAAAPTSDALECLLAEIQNPDVPDARGCTPLHVAARLQAIDACKHLCAARADPTRRNTSGTTALTYGRDPEVRAILKAAVARQRVWSRRKPGVAA